MIRGHLEDLSFALAGFAFVVFLFVATYWSCSALKSNYAGLSQGYQALNLGSLAAAGEFGREALIERDPALETR